MDLLSMIIESRNRFTPLSLSPALWLSDTGSDPAVWEDLSGNGRNATQGTALNQPAIISNGLNGRQVRRFDGTNDFLNLGVFNSFLSGGEFSIYTVATPTGSLGTTYRSYIGTSNDQPSLYYRNNTKFGFYYDGPRDFSTTLSQNTPYILGVKRSGSVWNGYVNGVIEPISQTYAGTWGAGSVYIGRESVVHYAQDIAEILVFPTALSDTNRQRVEAYLSSKWGIPTYDPYALDYFARVEAAGSTINADNKNAINQFIVGCKEDGNWTSIKASCILAGADTLSGALVPLVGTAPTNVGFLSGDYSPTSGLIGNGSTKYLNSNRSNSADPQDNSHLAVYVNTASTSIAGRYPVYIGAGSATVGESSIIRNQNNGALIGRYKSSSLDTLNVSGDITGSITISRSLSGSYLSRNNQTNTTITRTSQSPISWNLFVFATSFASGGTLPEASTYSNARISFYSIGESINLALLDTRLAKLMNSLRPTYDVTALDYFARVEAVGSTINGNNKDAVNDLFLTLKAQSIWPLISELYLFAGVDNLTGCLVKAKGSGSLTNTGFLSGDHNRTTGLLGDGSSKYLNTGFASNALSGTSNHIFVEGSGFETSGNPCAVGVFNGDEASILSLDFNNGASGRLYRSGRNSPATIPRITTGLISSGSFCGTRPSSASASIYQNGSPANTNTTATSPAFSTRPMFVFAFNNIGIPTTYTAARLRAVSIGSGLSDAQVSSLHTAISTYLSSLT